MFLHTVIISWGCNNDPNNWDCSILTHSELAPLPDCFLKPLASWSLKFWSLVGDGTRANQFPNSSQSRYQKVHRHWKPKFKIFTGSGAGAEPNLIFWLKSIFCMGWSTFSTLAYLYNERGHIEGQIICIRGYTTLLHPPKERKDGKKSHQVKRKRLCVGWLNWGTL